MIGIGGAQPNDEALCGARLAHRDGVQPEDRLVTLDGVKAEALADVAQVFRLLARAPQQAQKDVRRQQPQHKGVERSLIQHTAACCSVSMTAATSGTRSMLPRLTAFRS